MKIEAIRREDHERIPKTLEEGILYVSERFRIAIHLCACGCGGETVTPLADDASGWQLTGDVNPTLSPSIGNWAGKQPYHAHYFIRNGKVVPA